jgi:Tfp pilus assembly protein PilN
MIEINLLPPEHRPVERTPLPRLLAILGGVVLLAASGVALAYLALVAVPKATAERNNKRRDMEAEKTKAEAVLRLEQQLKAFEARESVLTALFRERICWSRLLDRLAEARKNSKDAVVLTALELKTTSTPGAAGKASESRQLYLKGYVPAPEGAATDLRKSVLEFIETLRKDRKFTDVFQGEPLYRGDRFIENLGTGTGGAKPDPRIPKSGLEFEVAFNFKAATPPPAPPPPPLPTPAPPAGH